MAAHARLKNEFAEDKKDHPLMTRLSYPLIITKYMYTPLIAVSLKPEIIELPHDKTNKMTCVPSEDSGQPGHRPV